jgi:non-ribosomal peptide synthetase component F
VVEGQRLMQAYGDILLGWKSAAVSGYPRDYYVRQFRDWKGSFEPAELNADQLETYAEACSWTLARAHARSGDRVAIAAYLGRNTRFDDAMADYAVAYADKTGTDYERVCAAADEGRLRVRTG